jgi:hypothetical protein
MDCAADCAVSKVAKAGAMGGGKLAGWNEIVRALPSGARLALASCSPKALFSGAPDALLL